MQIQWLGHSAFKIVGSEASVLIDPFLSGNPRFSGSLDEACDGVTHVLVTHAHNDHLGDAVTIMQKTGATLVAMVEITDFVQTHHGMNSVVGMNIGGTLQQAGVAVSMVQAFHSSSYNLADGGRVYGGMPAGLIVEMDGHRIYHMGDTGIFSDMGLINELYRPDIGIVPIGGHYTMDARAAALAVNRYFDFETVIPCHYLTFPGLAQSADPFVAAVKKGRVLTPQPMETLSF